MRKETEIALRNYEYLLRTDSEVAIDWDTDTVVDHIGGIIIDELLSPILTPAVSGCTSVDGPLPRETKIALKNWDWIFRHESDASLDWEAGILGYKDYGLPLSDLLVPGLTPATRG